MYADNPKIDEIEELAKFCQNHQHVFIYQREQNQRMIAKYLNMAELPIRGYVLPEVLQEDRGWDKYPIYSLPEMKEFVDKHKGESIGVILSHDERLYCQTAETMNLCGIEDCFCVSEWNKRTIPKKMRYRLLRSFFLEVNLADHCNLNCQCCDHFSPIATETFLDFDQYVRDIKRLAELTNGQLGIMKLQGGEPLLNGRLIDFMRVTREMFPSTQIWVFTAGLLLEKWNSLEPDKNIWEAVKKYSVRINLTRYPIGLDVDTIVKSAEEHGVPVSYEIPEFKKDARLWIFSEIADPNKGGIKRSVRHPFDLSGKQEKFRWISCYQFNESIVLRDGKIYTCPMIPYAHYYNEYFGKKLAIHEDCYIDIYKASSYEEIAEFCTHRTSFCDYCAVHKREGYDWKQSEHTEWEWTL